MSETLIELCAGTEEERWHQDGRQWVRQDILFGEYGGPLYTGIHGGDTYTYLTKLPDSFVDGFVINHALEHFNYVEGEHDGWYTTVDQILSEISRSLRTGGTLHIEVPNIMGSAREALAGNISEDQFCEYLYGGSDYQYNVHYAGFGPNSLKRRLEKFGLEGRIQDIGLVLVADVVKV